MIDQSTLNRYIDYTGKFPAPRHQTKDSAAFDLVHNGDFPVEVTGQYTFSTGIKWKPENVIGPRCFALILPRSSLFKHYKCIIPNSPGLIDADYSEEWKVVLFHLGVGSVFIQPGDRIAQAIILPHNSILREFAKDDTRVGGFGSTG